MPILRSAFIAFSRNQNLRRFAERSNLGRRMSSRFVAGMEIEDALRAAASLEAQGIASTLDSLGENVATPDEAQHSADIYHRLLDAIETRSLNANVSVKLTQMGMDLGHELAYGIVSGLVDHAVAAKTFVRVDMEGSEYTQATTRRKHRLGIVFQEKSLAFRFRGLAAEGGSHPAYFAPPNCLYSKRASWKIGLWASASCQRLMNSR